MNIKSLLHDGVCSDSNIRHKPESVKRPDTTNMQYYTIPTVYQDNLYETTDKHFCTYIFCNFTRVSIIYKNAFQFKINKLGCEEAGDSAGNTGPSAAATSTPAALQVAGSSEEGEGLAALVALGVTERAAGRG